MKTILFTLLFTLLASAVLLSQCTCNEVKFTINKTCEGKNAGWQPMYEGKLTISNKSKCKFTLTQIMQQATGDVALTLRQSIAPNNCASYTIVFTGIPPFAGSGNTPYFIVVPNLDEGKCKSEYPFEKLPQCTNTSCDCNSSVCSSDAAVKNVIHVGFSYRKNPLS